MEPTIEQAKQALKEYDETYAAGGESVYPQWAADLLTKRAASAGQANDTVRPARKPAVSPLNGIPETMRHGEGAYARCSYCQRYSTDPKTLSDDQPFCDCGKQRGWCGSFVRPDDKSTWSGVAPVASADQLDQLQIFALAQKHTTKTQGGWHFATGEHLVRFARALLLACKHPDSARIDYVQDWVVVQFPEGATGQNIRELVDSARKITDAQIAAVEAEPEL